MSEMCDADERECVPAGKGRVQSAYQKTRETSRTVPKRWPIFGDQTTALNDTSVMANGQSFRMLAVVSANLILE